MFLYSKIEYMETKIKNTILFPIILLKSTIYNLQNINNLNAENYKMLIKETKEDINS